MSPEYRLTVGIIARNAEQAEKKRQTISKRILGIRGVTQPEWEPSDISNPDDILARYLDELNSLQTPPHIEARWIRNLLYSLSIYDIRNWRRNGIIISSLGYPGKGSRLFTHEEARLIGHVWYFHEKGFPLKRAASIAQELLKVS